MVVHLGLTPLLVFVEFNLIFLDPREAMKVLERTFVNDKEVKIGGLFSLIELSPSPLFPSKFLWS